MKRDQPEGDLFGIGKMTDALTDKFKTDLEEKNKRIKVLEDFLENKVDNYSECSGCEKPSLDWFRCDHCSGRYCYCCEDLTCSSCNEPGCKKCCIEWKECIECKDSYCQECQSELAEISWYVNVCRNCCFEYLKEK